MLIAKIAKRRIFFVFLFFSLYWFAGGGYSHYMLILRIFHLYSALVFEDKAHCFFFFLPLKKWLFFRSMMMMTIHCGGVFLFSCFWHHVEEGRGKSLYRMDGATGNWALGGWISLCLINFAFLYLFVFFLSLFDSNTKICRSWLGEMS